MAKDKKLPPGIALADMVLWHTTDVPGVTDLRVEVKHRQDEHHRWEDLGCDPIGANYKVWREKMTDQQRIQLLLETVIDLAMRGFSMRELIRECFKVSEFRALGSESYPMSRAITLAVLGQCLNPETMTFEQLLVRYAPKELANAKA